MIGHTSLYPQFFPKKINFTPVLSCTAIDPGVPLHRLLGGIFCHFRYLYRTVLKHPQVCFFRQLKHHQGLIQWGGQRGHGPPQLGQNAPDFGQNALQIWTKCPHLHQSAPRIWAKCPPFATKVPRVRSGMAPNAPFRGQIFKIFWGRTPTPPLI